MPTRMLWSVIAVLPILAIPSAFAADELPLKECDVVELAEDVHGIVWKDALADPIEGNSFIVINERDVLVVDTSLFPSTFGSYYSVWPETLSKVEALDADIIFPGHGAVQRDNAYIHQLQAMLRDLVDEVDTAVADAATLEETKERVSLADWKMEFAGEDEGRQRAFTAFFVQPAVERAWRQAMGEPDTQKVN